MIDPVEDICAPAAIERALCIFRELREQDQSVIQQARKILTQHIYAMIDKREYDEQRLTVSGLARLKSIERGHAIKSLMVLQPKSESVDRRFQAKVRFESCRRRPTSTAPRSARAITILANLPAAPPEEDGYDHLERMQDTPRVVRLWRAGSKTAPSGSLKLPGANQSDLLRSPVRDVIEVG